MFRKTHSSSGLVSLAASLALCVACGGSSDGGSAGSAGAGNPGGGAGAGNPGGSAGGAGGTGTGSSATFSSSLPASEQLSSFSDQDVATLCKEVADFESGPNGAKLEDFGCRFSSVLAAALSGATTDAGLQAACKTAYDACTADPATSTTACTKPDATCTATVAELEACVNDSGPYIDQLLSQLQSCATLTQASLESAPSTSAPMNPASCTAYEAKCPDGDMPLPGAGT